MNLEFLLITKEEMAIPSHLIVFIVCEIIISVLATTYHVIHFLFIQANPDQPVNIQDLMNTKNYYILATIRLLMFPINLINFCIFSFGSAYQQPKYLVAK